MVTELLLAMVIGSTATPDAGVLIGLAHGGEEEQQRFRTLWLTWSAGKPTLSGDWPVLIVPHKDDFCQVRVEPAPTGSYTFTAFAIQCAAEMKPPAPETGSQGCQGEQTLSLSFVSPSYVGLEAWEESVCSGRVNSYPRRFVAPVTAFLNRWNLSPDRENLPIAAILPAEVTKDFEQYAREACVADEQRQQRDPEEMPIPLPDCRERLFSDQLRDWTIRRGKGRWNVAVKLAGWRGEVVYYEVPVDLPISVAPSQGAAYAGSSSTATDVLVSPDGQFAAEVVGDTITMNRSGTSPAVRSTLVVPKVVAERIAMAEWATGRFVEGWSKALKDRFGRGTR
jgi:hypothetical protein